MTMAHRWIEVKPMVLHFLAPLKLPVTIIAASTTGAEMMELAPPGAWIGAAAILGILLVVRSIIFVEFREHERKEKKLLDSLLVVSDSFDAVTKDMRKEIKDVRDITKANEHDIANIKTEMRGSDHRLRAIETSPLKKYLPQIIDP